ncbi:MAG: hypothetical protein IJA09_06070 [Bacteroidales bacterium]|nr:hypothetical protein [Bacteroidales bacterium]
MIEYSLQKIDWTAISAIASFLMVIATFITLIINQKQVRNAQRAKLNFRIMIYEKSYYLEIYNSGKENAYNIRLKISDSILDKFTKEAKECFISAISAPFFIKSNNSVYLFLGSCENINKLWKNKKFSIIIRGNYNKCYKINAKLPIEHFIGKIHMIVRTPIEHSLNRIAEGLVKPNTEPKHKDIQHSLHIIANNIQK